MEEGSAANDAKKTRDFHTSSWVCVFEQYIKIETTNPFVCDAFAFPYHQ